MAGDRSVVALLQGRPLMIESKQQRLSRHALSATAHSEAVDNREPTPFQHITNYAKNWQMAGMSNRRFLKNPLHLYNV